MESISLKKARSIVAHAENEFASRQIILDAFAPFARGGAATRSEAIAALKITIADYYRSSFRKGGIAKLQFEQYAKESGFIALRILADSAESPDALDAIMRSNGHQESMESYVNFLKELTPSDANFLNHVCRRIGVTIQESTEVALNFDIKKKKNRKQPRPLLALLICCILALGYFAFTSASFNWKNDKGLSHLLIAGIAIMTIAFFIRGYKSNE